MEEGTNLKEMISYGENAGALIMLGEIQLREWLVAFLLASSGTARKVLKDLLLLVKKVLVERSRNDGRCAGCFEGEEWLQNWLG